jgi:predicted glutamine amidotransferase
MFMHNGIIAGFSQLRRKLLEGLSDEAYDAVRSFHSDSAVSFALFLSFLPSMTEPQPPDVMLQALQRALQYIGSLQKAAGITDTSLLNFVLTDGETLIATRCVSPDTDKPASLYYAEGTTFRCVHERCSHPVTRISTDLPLPRHCNGSSVVDLVATRTCVLTAATAAGARTERARRVQPRTAWTMQTSLRG